ncbi:hypothetical protein BDZ89DRAFT_1151719 [Hymenopellis radicata]|nr:hypothetical protein BDZ89DRAFT_1151719 [Hymenopellis radicata]
MSSKWKNRFAGIKSTVDHSAMISKDTWLGLYGEFRDSFNNSPLAQYLEVSVDVYMLARKLCGMFGDHANGEKATSVDMEGWKMKEIEKGLGKEEMKRVVEENLDRAMAMLKGWEDWKIHHAGGLEAWNALPAEQRAVRDVATVDGMMECLGKEAISRLPPLEKRVLTTYVWTGCCAHKDQNSFKGGCVEMNAGWKELNLPPPIVLANKANAVLVQKALHPERGDTPLDDAAIAALEASTFGGAKLAALCGALFNNKEAKKGMGDVYLAHMRARHPEFTTFPKTSQTRFGSLGDAAGVLLRYRQAHLDILDDAQVRKKSTAFTNLEKNIWLGLKDPSTLVELACMAAYHESVTKPYMAIVRSGGKDNEMETNMLDLGPLHADILVYCERIIEEPNLLLEDDALPLDVSFDGEDWPVPEVMAAVRDTAKENLVSSAGCPRVFHFGPLPVPSTYPIP